MAETQSPYAAYVPRLAREWLDAPDPDATHRVVEGSAIFADISGFTKLSERLARLGKEGAEQVTEVIGDAFNVLLEPAYAYDGTLVKFGGDALLLFYRDEGHELRAASAALEMRRTLRSMGPIETPAGKVTLRMSQGVHSGEFDTFLVGSEVKELIMAGQASTHLASLESAANAGQIVVGKATARALPKANLGALKADGCLLKGRLLPRTEYVPAYLAIEHDLTAFVPSALREAIASGVVSSEHRQIATAFVRFTGLDELIEHDPGAAADVLGELVDDIEEATASRSIASLNADVYPDGVKFLITAGAPVTSGEDEEDMLLAMRQLLDKERALPLHIGVTRGPAFAGDVGTRFRRSYTVMGDEVNLAARLMSKAGPNQMLAIDEVLQGSRTLFSTTELEPFMVKGKSKPITAFVVGDPRGSRVDASGDDSPFLGRDDELKTLRGVWERANAGSGSLVLIGGDTGSGKSRLLDEFLETCNASIYRAVCRRYRASTPYFASTLLLGELLGVDRYHPDGNEERLTRVVEHYTPQLLTYLSLIGSAVGLDIEESDAVAALAPEFRTERLEQSIVTLLSAMLTEPTVFIVDDVQHMDDASSDLFAAIANASEYRPWVVGLVGRGAETLFEDMQAPRTPLLLGPIADEDATAIVYQCTDEAPLPPHVSARIVERAQGNPLFLHQLIAAVERDAVDELPESIEGVVAARIDRLLPEDRNALRQLAVLGSGFRPEFASVVISDRSAEVVLRRLTEFLEIEPEWVRFENRLVHRAAYSGLPFKDRRQLHGMVAESIKRAQGGADLLSVHYSAAARWPEAWKYSVEAGDKARDIYANLEAAALYERALDAARYVPDIDRAQRIAVLSALATVNSRAGLYEPAGKAVRKARQLAETPLDVARLSLEEARIADKHGKYSQALRWLTKGRQAVDGIEDREAEAMRAQLSYYRAAMRWAQGRHRESIAASERAIEEAQRSGNKEVLADAYYLNDMARAWSGQPGDNEYSWRALTIFEELEDPTGQAVVYINLAAFAYFDGRWSETIDLYAKSRAAYLRSGNPVGAARADEGLGEVLCDRGDLARAASVLDDAQRVLRAGDNPYEVAFVVNQLGRVASRDGRFEDADKLFADALAQFEEIGVRYDAVDVKTRMAENQVFQGFGARALDAIDEALEDAEPFGTGILFARSKLMRGYALTQVGKPKEALPEVEESLESARERGAQYEVALALEARSRIKELVSAHDWQDDLEETWAIQETLGIVSLPRVPLYQR